MGAGSDYDKKRFWKGTWHPIPGRVWVYYDVFLPLWPWWRNFLPIPFLQVDEFERRTFVLPLGPFTLVIALWFYPMVVLKQVLNPQEYRRHARWRRIYKVYGPITQKKGRNR